VTLATHPTHKGCLAVLHGDTATLHRACFEPVVVPRSELVLAAGFSFVRFHRPLESPATAVAGVGVCVSTCRICCAPIAYTFGRPRVYCEQHRSSALRSYHKRVSDRRAQTDGETNGGVLVSTEGVHETQESPA
jgi:hypothetical protein